MVVRTGRDQPRLERSVLLLLGLKYPSHLSPARDHPHSKCQKLVRDEGTDLCYLYLLFPETKSQ